MEKILKPKSVNTYIATAPKEVRSKLNEIRETIRETVPTAEERISYGMPYYGYKGKLAYFAFAKKHIGLYIMPPTLKKHEREVKKYRTGKATLQFSFDKKLPVALIKKLIKTGVKINDEKRK